jgi:hypothetical protein
MHIPLYTTSNLGLKLKRHLMGEHGPSHAYTTNNLVTYRQKNVTQIRIHMLSYLRLHNRVMTPRMSARATGR